MAFIYQLIVSRQRVPYMNCIIDAVDTYSKTAASRGDPPAIWRPCYIMHYIFVISIHIKGAAWRLVLNSRSWRRGR